MSPSLSFLGSLGAALVLALSPTPAPPSGATGAVEDLVMPVEDIIGEVQSLDGTESETKQGRQVTVALTSDVLFAVDKWALTAQARKRLREVAKKVTADSAGGVVRRSEERRVGKE